VPAVGVVAGFLCVKMYVFFLDIDIDGWDGWMDVEADVGGWEIEVLTLGLG